MEPLRATSETPNRAMVLTTLRVRVLMIWIRGPEVTAKSSCGAVRAAAVFAIGGDGTVMLVIGLEDCEGERSSGEEKVSQYFCSDVRELGPAASFAGCSGWISAAIVVLGWLVVSCWWRWLRGVELGTFFWWCQDFCFYMQKGPP